MATNSDKQQGKVKFLRVLPFQWPGSCVHRTALFDHLPIQPFYLFVRSATTSCIDPGKPIVFLYGLLVANYSRLQGKSGNKKFVQRDGRRGRRGCRATVAVQPTNNRLYTVATMRARIDRGPSPFSRTPRSREERRRPPLNFTREKRATTYLLAFRATLLHRSCLAKPDRYRRFFAPDVLLGFFYINPRVD